jgi:hypothetical protein
VTDAETLLLRTAFHHQVVADNLEDGHRQIAGLTCGALRDADFHAAVAACLRAGLIREPVRLPEGALQCHWHLELTPQGVEAARRVDDKEFI